MCNKLLHCVDCNQYYRRLRARREDEFQTFYRIERAYKQENKADLYYALSMKWFRKWEAFVLGRQEGKLQLFIQDLVKRGLSRDQFAHFCGNL